MMKRRKSDHLAQDRFSGDALLDSFLTENKIRWSSFPTTAEFQENFENLHGLLFELRHFETNAKILRLKSRKKLTPTEALIRSVHGELPDWADLEKIKRAEEIFSQDGAMICVLLFISSLPEVYRMQDISIMLNATGNLEKVTEQRIRTTALMTLSALLPGGLYAPTGDGRPRILRARFIHGVLRNFLLRDNPENHLRKSSKNVPPLKSKILGKNMFERAVVHGWNTEEWGLPCNQAEMGYTLLTFSYVYLRGLRRLGIGLSVKDENAYLHFWNVVGHFMGVEPRMMAHNMNEAERFFEAFAAGSSAGNSQKSFSEDPRRNLGIALVKTIEKSLEFEVLKPVVLSLMEFLTSADTVSSLGLDNYRSPRSSAGFHLLLKKIKDLDQGVRKLAPEASLMRMVIRIMGFQLLKKVLSDPTNPIDLPAHQKRELEKVIKSWSHDTMSPVWLNLLEDVFTVRADWNRKLKF